MQAGHTMRKVSYLFYILLLAFIVLIRFRFLDFPLERDEGEYAYMGQLILEGIPPYKLAFNMKLPGTYFIYAIVMKFFGQTVFGIHLGLLLFSYLSSIFLFLISENFFDKITAFFISIIFILLSASSFVVGFAFHATHLVTFFYLVGIYFYLNGIDSNKIHRFFFLSGFFFGLSFLMKQQSIFLLFFIILFTFYNELMNKNNLKIIASRILIIGIGIILPFLCMLVYIYYAGVFQEFYFWTFQYASKYVGLISFSEGFQNLLSSLNKLSHAYEILFIFAVVGIFVLSKIKTSIQKKVFIYMLFVFSFLTTVPGFYFRGHYFIPFIPVITLFYGSTFFYLKEKITKKNNKIFFIIFNVLIILYALNLNKPYFFKDSISKIFSNLFSGIEFEEILKISDYIQKNSEDKDEIAVIGSEPELFFYTKRKSATGFIYLYPLIEDHIYSASLLQKMFDEIEKKNPKFIVINNHEVDYFKDKTKIENLEILNSGVERIKNSNLYEKECSLEFSYGKTVFDCDKRNLKKVVTNHFSLDVYKRIQ